MIEFSKDNKKIILSHSKVYMDVQAGEKAKANATARKEEQTTRSAVKKIKDSVEKTTLGDLSVLANLKSNMEQEAREKLEKMSKQKKGAAKKDEEKADEPKKADEEK